MRLNYPAIISELDETLIQQKHEQRGTHLTDRVRLLRLLKAGQASTLLACTAILGYSSWPVHRWWQTCRYQGLQALLQRGSSEGRPAKLHSQA